MHNDARLRQGPALVNATLLSSTLFYIPGPSPLKYSSQDLLPFDLVWFPALLRRQDPCPLRLTMASRDHQEQRGQGHYSGQNKVPDIKTFVRNLDKEKRDRDKELDERRKAEQRRNSHGGSEVKPHTPGNAIAGKEGTRKTVTDPTTGNQVQIEDVDANFMKAVEDPQLSVPNANLNRDTTVKTDASQSNPEYKHNQDITAPPDPVAEGSTSDVPIHGEKTNILFHPTPSVSYEPMFAALEQRAGGLCIGVFLAIVILGKMFGGSLKGLIPTAACIVSGIWLWMKEVVRSGREVEWSSEQSRGETVSFAPYALMPGSKLMVLGNGEPTS